MQEIRNIAYEFILKEGVIELPITLKTLEKIIRKRGWILSSYSNSKKFFESYTTRHQYDLSEYSKTKAAFALVNLSHPIIFYRDDLGILYKIFAILHEIAHIYLKHTNCNGILGLNYDPIVSEIQEKEANIFACEVCAPLPVLSRCHIHTLPEFERTGLIDKEYSKTHFIEFSEFVSNPFNTAIEQKICKQFKSYIHEKNIIYNKQKAKKYILVFIAFLIGILVSATAFNTHDSTHLKSKILTPPALNDYNNIQLNDIVYITDAGKKYHAGGCQYIKNKNNIKSINTGKAIDLGYEPCSICLK